MLHLYFQEVENISQEEFQSNPPKHTAIIVVDNNRCAKIQKDSTQTPFQAPTISELIRNIKLRSSKVTWLRTLGMIHFTCKTGLLTWKNSSRRCSSSSFSGFCFFGGRGSVSARKWAVIIVNVKRCCFFKARKLHLKECLPSKVKKKMPKDTPRFVSPPHEKS